MNVFLPLALLAICAVSALLQHSKPTWQWPNPVSLVGLVLLALFGVLAVQKCAPSQDSQQILLALLAGMASVCVMTALDSFNFHSSAIVALAAIGPAAFVTGQPRPVDAALLAAPAGAALTALILPSRSASLVTIVISLSCICALCGYHGDPSFVAPSAGVVLFGAIALVGVAGLALNRLIPKAAKTWPVIACLAIVAIGYAASIKYLSLGPGWVGVSIAPAIALLVYWLLETSSKEETFPLLVAAALWLGLATAAYGLSKSFGVSLALLLGVGTLAILDADRALLTTGPMLAVVLTQLFRQLHPDAVRSVDVGQHYVLIGLAVGALIPLLPFEWARDRSWMRSTSKSIGSLIWTAVLCLAPLLIGIYLAPKGLVGFVAGLGFSSLLTGVRQTPILVTALAAGIACLSILEYGWMGDLTDLDRAQKVHWVLIAAVAIAVVSAALAALSIQKGKPVAEAA